MVMTFGKGMAVAEDGTFVVGEAVGVDVMAVVAAAIPIIAVHMIQLRTGVTRKHAFLAVVLLIRQVAVVLVVVVSGTAPRSAGRIKVVNFQTAFAGPVTVLISVETLSRRLPAILLVLHHRPVLLPVTLLYLIN